MMCCEIWSAIHSPRLGASNRRQLREAADLCDKLMLRIGETAPGPTVDVALPRLERAVNGAVAMLDLLACRMAYGEGLSLPTRRGIRQLEHAISCELNEAFGDAYDLIEANAPKARSNGEG